jgi:hypothetical protein
MIKSQFFLCWLILSTSLFGQHSLELLLKLDKGLPLSGRNGSNLGEVISYIGDINNDGYDDWAVGLPTAADYLTGERTGKVYIYFGDISIQNNKDPDLILSGREGRDYFGKKITNAGDVNNDGYSDILIASNKNTAIYYGGHPMDPEPDIVFKNGSIASISGAGDINHDGFDDVIIGSKNYAHIYYGGSDMDSEADVILRGESERDYFGYCVSGAGDVNNDGYDDVIIGAQGYYSDGYDAGRVYIYYGGTDMDTIADIVVTGEKPGIYFGETVSDAGDLNNDGFADVIVSAYRYENESGNYGRVFIYYGSETNDTIADLLIEGGSIYAAGDVNNDGFDDVFIYTSDNKSIFFGDSLMDSIPDISMEGFFKMAGKGDYNHDGFDDIIAGDPKNDFNGENAGRVLLYYGGLKMNSTPDVELYGEPAGDTYGSSVSLAGDFNNDGYDDVIIGSPYNDEAASNAGSAYIYCGGINMDTNLELVLFGQKKDDHFGESVSDAGDVNGDGFDDLVAGGFGNGYAQIFFGNSSMDNVTQITFTNANASSHFGNCVSSAGDFNGDGFDDVIIGDFCNYISGTHTGRAYLYFGGPAMDTIPDLTLEGEAEYNNFGAVVAYAGDLNDDGYSDVMVGAPHYERDNERVGRIYIYLGGLSPDTIPDVIITGTNYPWIGSYAAGAGDVNHDGYDDIILGSPHLGSLFGVPSYVYIYFGGSSMDTIPDIIFEKKDLWGFGQSVSWAGDLNSDDYDDVIISDHENVYIYFGGSDMDTICDIILKGVESTDGFGRSTSFAGDVNSDGHPDILIGAPNQSAAGYHMGRAYIYSYGIEISGTNAVNSYANSQNYPNPFQSSLTIQYVLNESDFIVIKIFNLSGQLIETLINGYQTEGRHEITWHPKNLSDGIYIYSIRSHESSETKKIILQK